MLNERSVAAAPFRSFGFVRLVFTIISLAMSSFLTTAMSEADINANLKLISAELSFLFTKEGVPDEIQAKSASLG